MPVRPEDSDPLPFFFWAFSICGAASGKEVLFMVSELNSQYASCAYSSFSGSVTINQFTSSLEMYILRTQHSLLSQTDFGDTFNIAVVMSRWDKGGEGAGNDSKPVLRTFCTQKGGDWDDWVMNGERTLSGIYERLGDSRARILLLTHPFFTSLTNMASQMLAFQNSLA